MVAVAMTVPDSCSVNAMQTITVINAGNRWVFSTHNMKPFSEYPISCITISRIDYDIDIGIESTSLVYTTTSYTPETTCSMNICILLFKNKRLILRCTICIGHSFDTISMLTNVHNRNAGYFTNSSFQILITCRNNIAFMLKYEW